MNRDLLEKPFPDNLIRNRKGRSGQTFSYVEGSAYIARLNDALDGEWSFEITEHQIHENEVIVLGKLTAGQVTKMAFGGSSITVAKESGEVISIADDLKSASTDALKKSASLLGVGLHLHSADKPTETTSAAPRTGNGNGHSSGNGNGQGNGAGRKQCANGTSKNTSNGNRLTQRQLSAIWGMGRSLGLSADQIRERSVTVFGAVPEHLSKSDASSFITELGEGMSAPVAGAA